MNFEEIISWLVDGKKLRREIWPDDGTHICMVNEKLSIYKPEDKLYHPLTVSAGDLSGNDWVVC
jgi:hypothetical protein